jgi:5-(carboxyamino)imidazole ribonucleotide synthase
MLRLSLAPAPGLTSELQGEAEELGRHVLEALGYVGVLAVEFFQTAGRRRGTRPSGSGHLLANEMAPRVHNSGHWTIEGAETSQFENHLRAILGVPLGGTACAGHSAMVNLIGTAPDSGALLGIAGLHLHLYGKTPRPGRKLGHLTLHCAGPEVLRERLDAVQRLVEV